VLNIETGEKLPIDEAIRRGVVRQDAAIVYQPRTRHRVSVQRCLSVILIILLHLTHRLLGWWCNGGVSDLRSNGLWFDFRSEHYQDVTYYFMSDSSTVYDALDDTSSTGYIFVAQL